MSKCVCVCVRVSRLKVFGFSGAKNQMGESIAKEKDVAPKFLITFTAITNKVLLTAARWGRGWAAWAGMMWRF